MSAELYQSLLCAYIDTCLDEFKHFQVKGSHDMQSLERITQLEGIVDASAVDAKRQAIGLCYQLPICDRGPLNQLKIPLCVSGAKEVHDAAVKAIGRMEVALKCAVEIFNDGGRLGDLYDLLRELSNCASEDRYKHPTYTKLNTAFDKEWMLGRA